MTPRGKQIIAGIIDTRLSELATARRDETPPTTHGSPGRDSSGGADALWYARAAIRSASDLDDATVAEACRQIIGVTDGTVARDERNRAADLLRLIEGETV